MGDDDSKDGAGARDDSRGFERLKASVGAAMYRAKAFLTRDRLLAGLCLVVALLMAAPWVRVPVVDLLGRDVAFSVPDLLVAGQLVADRAQSLGDLVDQARDAAERAARIVERAQDAAERLSDARDERG